MAQADIQRAYRKRVLAKAARSERLAEGMIAIVSALAGNEKPLAVTIRNIAMSALADPKPEN